LRALVEEDDAVVLMGVDLTSMTLLHLAEVEAGRRPFIRWARGPDGRAVRVRAGECSKGFDSLAPALAPVERQVPVGDSRWRVFPAREAMKLAAQAIRTDPSITHCPNPGCIECEDAIVGGPLDWH
jgi:aminoglycoside 3-N-acetyltransferase